MKIKLPITTYIFSHVLPPEIRLNIDKYLCCYVMNTHIITTYDKLNNYFCEQCFIESHRYSQYQNNVQCDIISVCKKCYKSLGICTFCDEQQSNLLIFHDDGHIMSCFNCCYNYYDYNTSTYSRPIIALYTITSNIKDCQGCLKYHYDQYNICFSHNINKSDNNIQLPRKQDVLFDFDDYTMFPFILKN
jgi:hypothetical protein